jgi:hypothetical protein
MKNVKIEIEKMKLGEQEEFELLANCSLHDLMKKGLSGRRLAALIYIFAKRDDKTITFEQCLDLDMEQATNMIGDDADPKGNNA